MLKFILISFLFMYLFFKLGGFILRILFPSLNPNRQKHAHTRYRKQTKHPADGNVDIQIDRNQKRKKTDFKGGDYINYEEVD